MGENHLQRFAAYVREAALAAGYEVDKPRSGAKLKLAAEAGMSPSTLSRMLSGERMPDPKYFQGLANALHVPVNEFLVEAGIIGRESLDLRAVLDQPVTPEDVADAWGIHDEAGRELVRAMYERLARRRTNDDQSREDSA